MILPFVKRLAVTINHLAEGLELSKNVKVFFILGVVQTQSSTAYCKILSRLASLDPNVYDIFLR